jgi:hypothetical protein
MTPEAFLFWFGMVMPSVIGWPLAAWGVWTDQAFCERQETSAMFAFQMARPDLTWMLAVWVASSAVFSFVWMAIWLGAAMVRKYERRDARRTV